MRMNSMARGLGWGVLGFCVLQGLSGCMASKLYNSIQEHPYNESYDYNTRTIRLPKFDDASTQPIEISYHNTQIDHAGAHVEHFARADAVVDFSVSKQTLVLPKIQAVEDIPDQDLGSEGCPRQTLRQVVALELPALDMVSYQDLQKNLAPCKSGYVAYTTYTAPGSKYRFALFKVDEAGGVQRSYVSVPTSMTITRSGNLWHNVGAGALYPVALAADICLYFPFEWMYALEHEDPNAY
jgi:hypothetical protein